MKAVKYLVATLLLTLSFSAFAEGASCLEKSGEERTDVTNPGHIKQRIASATNINPEKKKKATPGDTTPVQKE